MSILTNYPGSFGSSQLERCGCAKRKEFPCLREQPEVNWVESIADKPLNSPDNILEWDSLAASFLVIWRDRSLLSHESPWLLTALTDKALKAEKKIVFVWKSSRVR